MSLADRLRRMLGRPYTTVRPAEAAELVESGAILLDVREQPEWVAGHAPRARHIPLGQLARRHGELPAGRTVITVCRSGHRSARAAALLAREGVQVVNLSGGMRAWVAAGLPVVGKGSRPGAVV